MALEKFKNDVRNGLRLSIDEIKTLKPDWKKFYENEIIQEYVQVTKKVNGTQGIVTKELYSTRQDINKLENVKKDYNKTIVEINDRIRDKKFSMGLARVPSEQRSIRGSDCEAFHLTKVET